MKLKILFVCDPFGSPTFLPRIRFFCDYLVKKQHEVDVYTEKYEKISFDHAYPITEIPFYYNAIDRFLKKCWTAFTMWKDRYFFRRLLPFVQNKQYDVVFCSTFANFPLLAAYKLAKKLHLPLIVDVRDIVEQVPENQIYANFQTHVWFLDTLLRNLSIKRRNFVLKNADALITISKWHKDLLSTINSNTHLIYNGYDPKQFYFEAKKSDNFYISYIGRLFQFQKTNIVEKCVKELGLPKIKIRFYTPQTILVPISEVGDVIRKSSIMLVFSNKNARGVLTTKFYEALGCEKPVLCVPSDEGQLADIIRYTNAGIASFDKEEIKNFILEKYNQWQEKGYTHQNVKHKEEFSRINETEKLESLLIRYV